MKSLFQAIAAGAAGLLALGVSSAYADQDRSAKSAYCDSRYDDCYERDRYHRSGAKRNSGLSISVRVGDDYRYRDAYYRGRSNGYRSRVVNRQVFDTRYRARIVLTEEIRYNRRGKRRLVCTVRARGPEANYVSVRRMHRIANRACSPRARVRVLT